MLAFDDLRRIPEEKKSRIRLNLEELLQTFRSDTLVPLPVITGYAWLDRLAESPRVITLSHSHDSPRYKSALFGLLKRKLSLSIEVLQSYTRDRGSAYFWNPESYKHRYDNGKLHKGKKIKILRTREYLDLEDIKTQTITADRRYRNQFGIWDLISEDSIEWQLDIPFKSKKQLLDITDIFIEYVIYGNKKPKRERLPNLYGLPLVIIGEKAVQFYAQEDLLKSQFTKAKRVYLTVGKKGRANGNEIYLIVGNGGFANLETTEQYAELQRIGFKTEDCLVNTDFALGQLCEQPQVLNI